MIRLLRRAWTKALWRMYPRPNHIDGMSFVSWNTCHQACSGESTYESAAVADELVRESRYSSRTATDSEQFTGLMGMAMAHCRSPGRRIRVLDFGGGAGVHYNESCRAFGPMFDWTVVETPASVRAAQALGVPGLKFVETITEATKTPPDIVLISGSLQYCHDPAKTIADLAAIDARCFVMRRTPIISTDQNDLAGWYWIQRPRFFHHFHGGQTSTSRFAYPISFLKESALAPLDAGRRRIFDLDMGALYRVGVKSTPITGRTIVWV